MSILTNYYKTVFSALSQTKRTALTNYKTMKKTYEGLIETRD